MDQANIIEISDEQEEDVPQQYVPKENEEEKTEEQAVSQNEETESEIPDIEEIEDSTPNNKNVSLSISFENVNRELVDLLQSFINTNFEKYEKKKKKGITATVTYYPDFCINTIPKEEEEFTTRQSQYDVFSKINDDLTNKTIARKRKRDLLNCWNCGSTEHQDRDESTIEKNRKLFVESKEIKKTPLKSSLRYYEEEVVSEKGFEQLIPGELLPELKIALGMSKSDDIPPYINRFQIIGYPPAYIKNEGNLNDYSDNDCENNDKDTIIIVENEDDHVKVDILDKENEEKSNNNDINEINNNENNNNNNNNKITYKIHHFPRCTCNKELSVKYPSISGNDNNNNYYYEGIVNSNNCVKHYPLEFSSPVLEELIKYSQSKLNNNNNNNNRKSSYNNQHSYYYHQHHQQQQYNNNNNIDIYNNNQYPLLQQQQQQQLPYYPPPSNTPIQLYNPPIQPQQYYNDYNYYQPQLTSSPPPPLPSNYYFSNPGGVGYENEQYTNYDNSHHSSHSHSRHGHSHSHSHHHHHSYRDDDIDDDYDHHDHKRSRRDDY